MEKPMEKFDEFVRLVVANNEKIMGQMPELRAKSVVRAVLRQIAAEIDRSDEGEVLVPTLGRFVVQQVTPEGKPARKLIIFRRVGARPKAAE